MRRTGEQRWPVSVKGVLLRRGRVLLLRNHRGEWELPGGRLEPRESPEEALAREIREETGLTATVGSLVDAWIFAVTPRKRVVVLAYACRLRGRDGIRTSPEHRMAAWLAVAALAKEPLPRGYLRSIRRAAKMRGPG
jgi:ADP-ribose pyrophosphatase YjhB (NUDIX family)